jgi:hypothetical protein
MMRLLKIPDLELLSSILYIKALPKSGGYNIEDAQVSEPRLLTLMLLVSIAYTATIIEGKLVKKMGVQKYWGGVTKRPRR